VSTDSDSEAGRRKARQLEICLDPEAYSVEGGRSRLGELRFVHRALPELDAREVDPSLDFLGRRIALPILISCMTGGSKGGGQINRALAEAAQAAGVPVGTGSMRALLREEGLFAQFHVKVFAPDVPVIANLGAAQLLEFGRDRIVEALKRLEAQAIALHLNAGQELFQPEGDRDFRGLKAAIASFCDASPLPVIVKETGFGISPADAEWLLEAGAAYVDLAASGGTNWILVESYRLPPRESALAREFDDWGMSAPLLLLALAKRRSAARKPAASGSRVIASGGLRSGLDLAKVLALGAELGGFALPFARAAQAGGAEGALRLIGDLERSLKAAMTMTGSADLQALRAAPLLVGPSLEAEAEELAFAESAPA
jgi:isopentenyl-diphosphate delta-isomerase type 2